MPINYPQYPSHWLTEIRPRILARAKHKCENCGLANHTIVFSVLIGSKRHWYKEAHTITNIATKVKKVRVILTIAHLDHDHQNIDVKDDRLKALCQLCHLSYDLPHKNLNRIIKKSL